MRRRLAELAAADTSATPLHKAAYALSPPPTARRLEADLLTEMQALIKSGASVNERDAAGVTPTHTAAAYGTCALLGALLEAGADLAAIDIVGQVGWFSRHGVGPMSDGEWRNRLRCTTRLRMADWSLSRCWSRPGRPSTWWTLAGARRSTC
jgi:hypothetical protein